MEKEEQEFKISYCVVAYTGLTLPVLWGLLWIWLVYDEIRDLLQGDGTGYVTDLVLKIIAGCVLTYLIFRKPNEYLVQVGAEGLTVRASPDSEPLVVNQVKEDGTSFLLYTEHRTRVIPKKVVPGGFEEAIGPFLEDEA